MDVATRKSNKNVNRPQNVRLNMEIVSLTLNAPLI